MVKSIILPSEVVKGIEQADLRATALKDLVSSLMEKHANDPDNSFIGSPGFQQLLNQYAEANGDYKKKKLVIEPKYVPQEEGYVAQNWNLNYESCTLTVEYAEQSGLHTV